MNDMRWSEDNAVFYLEGQAWGVNKNLRTVWLGKEEDVIKTHPVLKRRTPSYRVIRRKESQI